MGKLKSNSRHIRSLWWGGPLVITPARYKGWITFFKQPFTKPIYLHRYYHFNPEKLTYCQNAKSLQRFSEMSYFIKHQSCHHIETSQLICSVNQLTGFYMIATLAFNELSTVLTVVAYYKCVTEWITDYLTSANTRGISVLKTLLDI